MFDKITVKVPATSANLGPGFDTLGIALKIYNFFDLEYLPNEVETVNSPQPFTGKNNLVYKSMEYILERGGYVINHGFKITFRNNIPFGSGLGSSATCIVAGLLMGNALINNKFSKQDILDFAVIIEGHGDNVTPCIFGGLTVYMNHSGLNQFQNATVSKNIKFGVLTSSQKKASTKELRKFIPDYVSIEDAVYNLSHLAQTIVALEKGNCEMLKLSMNDKIHEQKRSSYIENFKELKLKVDKLNGISLNVSGAGPTLLVVYNNDFKVDEFTKYVSSLPNDWKFIECGIDEQGGEIC